MINMSFNAKRIVLGVLLFIYVVCLANYYLELGAFGGFAKPAMVISLVILGAVFFVIGPTVREVEEFNSKKREH